MLSSIQDLPQKLAAGVNMKLTVVLWAYGILKVVQPAPEEPIYLLYDPACRIESGAVEVKVTNWLPDDPPPHDPMGTLTQGGRTCDVEELVFSGP
jgi:hypothetical protein